jgi:uncharacterized MnhB-related membrane protein
MAIKFSHTLIFSTATGLAVGALFYILSAGKSAISEAYTVTDTNLGSAFVFLLTLIIGLSLWPRMLERRS